MKKRLIWFLRGTRSSDRQSGGWCSHFSGCQSDKSQVVRRSKLQRTAIRVSKCFCGLGLFMLDGPNAAAGGLTVLSGRKPGLKRGSSLLIKLWAPTAVKTSAPSGLCRARILSVGLDVKMFSSSDSIIFPPFSFSFSFPLQGGSSRVPQEKERVRQMSGKPRGCVGKPKQDPDWRAESTEGHLLPQSWVAAAVLWSRAEDGAVYRLLQQNVKKKQQNKTKQKRLWNKNCIDRLCFSAHSGPVYSEASRGYSNSSSLPVFRSRSYLVVFACEDSSVVHTMLCCCFLCTGGRGGGWGGAKPANESQREEEGTGRGNTGASWKCVAPAQEIMTKTPPLGRSAGGSLTSKVSLRSDEVQREAPADPPPAATRQLNRVYLIASLRHVRRPVFFFLFRSFHAFLRAKTQLKEKSPIIIKVSSVKWFPGIHQLFFCFQFV